MKVNGEKMSIKDFYRDFCFMAKNGMIYAVM